MISLVPEWAPNIHPTIVHFPLALLFIAALMDAISLFLPEKWWNERISTLLYGIGTLSVLFTYLTGRSAADTVFMPAETQTVLNQHADWAWFTLWFFGLYLLLRILFHYLSLWSRTDIRIVVLITVLPGLFLLYQTGDHGAKMVFGYGVGTGQLISQKQAEDQSLADSLAAVNKTTFRVKENGDWVWEIGPYGVNTLLDRFTWQKGSAEDLQPTVIESGDNYLLRVRPDSSVYLFTGQSTYKNVQVDLFLDITDFRGSVSLLHHLQNSRNYDFVELQSDGSISQGRVTGGEIRGFAGGTFSSGKKLFLRVVANGTHYRAYINKKLVVHGHGEAPRKGRIGLRIEGKGPLLFDKITLTQL